MGMVGLSDEAQVCQTQAPPLVPKITLPTDRGVAGFDHLFDNEWVWQAFRDEFGVPEETPQRIRLQQLRYQPGVRALVSYVTEQQWGNWILEDQFAVELRAGRSERLFRFPNDPYLPGLRQAASPVDAHQLLTRCVPISPTRLRVETIRYRPGNRAVLRYIASWRKRHLGNVNFFVRVMPPRRLERFLVAGELASGSGFATPRIVGCWKEGGVVWMTEVPGETVRARIREGTPPHPEPVLDALAGLWSTPIKPDQGHPLDLLGGFRTTDRLLSHLLRSDDALRLLQQLKDTLGPFAEKWRPSAVAHNDFYDDQMLVTPEGRLALVDFEEIGPGDPLLDVGKMLAHLRRMARFGNAKQACRAYHGRFRTAALERFGWDPQDLNLREAFALFRLSANPIHQLRRDWARRVETGLALALDVAEGCP